MDMKAKPVYCGDCCTLLSECAHSANYLQELKTSAERLVQLTRERKEMK